MSKQNPNSASNVIPTTPGVIPTEVEGSPSHVIPSEVEGSPSEQIEPQNLCGDPPLITFIIPVYKALP